MQVHKNQLRHFDQYEIPVVIILWTSCDSANNYNRSIWTCKPNTKIKIEKDINLINLLPE